jgi:hypothetical protein
LAVLLILDVLVWLRERQARIQASADELDGLPVEPPAGKAKGETGEQ